MTLAVGLNTGCTDPNVEKISMLQDENARLMTEREDAKAQLARVEDDAANWQRKADQLQRKVNELNNQLAATPKPPEGWKGVPGGAMTSIPAQLLFDSGKATLRSGAAAALDKIAQTILAEFPDKDIYVFGHTDAQPIKESKWRDNRQLSAERAMAVTAFLRTKGIAPEQIIAAAAGEYRPAVEGAVAEQRNRRVEIFAVTGMVSKGGGDRP